MGHGNSLPEFPWTDAAKIATQKDGSAHGPAQHIEHATGDWARCWGCPRGRDASQCVGDGWVGVRHLSTVPQLPVAVSVCVGSSTSES